MLADKIEYYNKYQEKLNNTPAQYKSEYAWLKEVDSLALSNAQLNLQSSYNNFFRDKKVGFPKYKSKKCNKHSYTTNYVNGNIVIQDGKIKLPKIGFVKMKQSRTIPENYKLKAVTVSKNASDNYYVSILFEYENQAQKTEPQKFLGLDFSMHELYVASDGTSAQYPRFYHQALNKLKKNSVSCQKCKKAQATETNSESELQDFTKKLPINVKIFCISCQGR